MGSSRLPGKVMRPLAGKPALWHVWDRVNRCKDIDCIVFATTTQPADVRIVDYCQSNNWSVIRGSETDVLSRYHLAATEHQADTIIRVTSDCPLIDPAVLTRLIRKFHASELDYMSTNYPKRTFPVGLDCEIMTMQALHRAHEEADKAYDREHVTPYFYTNPNLFKLAGITDIEDRSGIRLTLDTADDYKLLATIYERHYEEGGIIAISDAIAVHNEWHGE